MANALNIQDIIDLHLILDDTYQTSYAKALAASDNWAMQFAKRVPTMDTHIRLPFLYETIGIETTEIGAERKFDNFLAQYVDIGVKQYGGGATLHQTKFYNPIETQMVMDKIETLAIENAYYPLTRLVNALEYGDTDPYYTTYDGQQFFSATHSVGTPGVSWSNLTTGLLYDPSNVGAVYNAVKTNMRRIPWGPNGRYLIMNGAQWYVIVPPSLEIDGRKLFNNTWYLQNNLVGDNPFNGNAGATLIVEPRLVDQNNWYVVALLPGQSARPFVYVDQDIPGTKTLISNIDPTSPNVFYKGMLEWSLVGYGEVREGQFFLCTKVVNS